jgi:hypothetical protein
MEFKAGDIVRFKHPEGGEENELYEVEEAFYDIDEHMPAPRMHVRLYGDEFSIAPSFVMSPDDFILAVLPNHKCTRCGGLVDEDEAVWIDPQTAIATCGDSGAPYHVECAPEENY